MLNYLHFLIDNSKIFEFKISLLLLINIYLNRKENYFRYVKKKYLQNCICLYSQRRFLNYHKKCIYAILKILPAAKYNTKEIANNTARSSIHIIYTSHHMLY